MVGIIQKGSSESEERVQCGQESGRAQAGLMT